MRICGIDPGLRCTGYAILEVKGASPAVVEAGVVRSDASLALPARLLQLARDMGDLLDEHHPDAVIAEKLYSHYAHPVTAILMGHARGVILAAAARQHAQVVEISATRIKRLLTGNGHASKIQVQTAVVRLLRLARRPQPPDVADAIAISLAGWRRLAADKAQARLPGRSM